MDIDTMKEAYKFNSNEIEYDQYAELLLDLYCNFEQRLRKLKIVEKSKEVIEKIKNINDNKLKNIDEIKINELQNIINKFKEIKNIAFVNCAIKRNTLNSFKFSYLRNESAEGAKNIFNNISINIINEEIKFYIKSEKSLILLLDNINEINLSINNI